MNTAIEQTDCKWADTRQTEYEEAELFCNHWHNMGGWCVLALGEGCEYQQEE